MDDTVSTLIILGGTGDLASRLLLPGLGRLLTEQPDRRIRLIGSGRQDRDDEQWTDTVRGSFDTVGATGPAVDHALADARYLSADVSAPEDLEQLLGAATGIPALYFALPPAVTAKAVDALQEVELPEGTVLAMEKPFGTNRQNAAELNAMLAELVPQEQVFRVDHFLGTSTVLNVLGLRFTNRLFEPLWNRDHISRVDVVYDEELGLEGRAGYYDGTGAMVDMLQSHLLQAMALVTMEPPATVEATELQAAKSQAVRSVRLWAGDPARASRRARYTAGTVGGQDLPDYVDEEGVDPELGTETLAEVTVEADTWRWAGVPFTLRSGKAIGDPRQEIVVTFRQTPRVPDGLRGAEDPTVLRIGLGSPTIALGLNINGPGDPLTIDRAELATDFGEGRLNPYGEVLQSILDRDPTLSVRSDAVEHAWALIDQIRDAWQAGRVPLEEYPAGSPGPDWSAAHEEQR
ncbi:glucose-6-phosphate dehydrogenase [Kocuria turfanensis]|uniref:Glucose-6-phosphate 1-dehydrogenase n=1 Tax=Kocuria turfanensis TaxID=388357 RepID=A0A512IFG8_9MICC|nr:glucose-6-phosphate dehydrogenase [Kocuria turfanensis]GEO96418.1 glucose-6-phosphate 1-dehydrogenase [Kocuria turfanensis]